MKLGTARSSKQGITMRTCRTRASQADLGIFTHIPAYLDILRQNQAYSGIIHTYSGIFQTLCNSSIFKTPVSSEPWNIQNSTHIRNISFLRSLLYDTLFFNTCLSFTTEVFQLRKNVWDRWDQGPRAGVMNFDIPVFICVPGFV